MLNGMVTMEANELIKMINLYFEKHLFSNKLECVAITVFSNGKGDFVKLELRDRKDIP